MWGAFYPMGGYINLGGGTITDLLDRTSRERNVQHLESIRPNLRK